MDNWNLYKLEKIYCHFVISTFNYYAWRDIPKLFQLLNFLVLDKKLLNSIILLYFVLLYFIIFYTLLYFIIFYILLYFI